VTKLAKCVSKCSKKEARINLK